MVNSVAVNPCSISAFTRAGEMDNATEANTDIVKASGRTVDDVKILHV